MSSFLGTHSIIIDDKGRFNVPAKIKAILEEHYGSNLVICVKEDYLMVFPQKEWNENEKKLEHLNAFDEEDRKKLRRVYSQAAECEIKSGKILIPANQRDQVGIKLKEEAVLVGMSHTFEIWSQNQWAKNYG